jgi:hypothetical protein
MKYTIKKLETDLRALSQEADDCERALARARIEGNSTKMISYLLVYFHDYWRRVNKGIPQTDDVVICEIPEA